MKLKTLTTIAGGVCISGLIIGGSVFYNQIQKEKNKIAEKIAQKDINQYNSINQNIQNGKMRNSYANWLEEYSKMQDSLKIDSIAKKAYNEGAQMVRDSIKNEYKKMQDSLKIDSMIKKAYNEGAQIVRDSIKTASKIK